MTGKALARLLSVAGTFAAFMIPQIASATAAVPCETSPTPSNVMSCATGLSVNLSVLNLLGVQIGPLDNAFGTAPGPYSVSNSLATFTSSAGIGLATFGVNITGDAAAGTKAIVDTASSPYNGSLATLTATATSTVDGLGVALGIPAVKLGPIIVTPALSFLGISAKTLTSTSTATKVGGGKFVSFAGTSSEIEDLSASVAGVNVLANVNVLAATAPNDVLFNLGGLDITANYQNPIYLHGNDLIGIQTAALAIKLDNFAFGTGLLNGTILIADSAASVPETGTWLMMLTGFGVAGAVMRRRRSLALA